MNKIEVKAKLREKLTQDNSLDLLSDAVISLFSAQEQMIDAARRTSNIHRLLSNELESAANGLRRSITNILD